MTRKSTYSRAFMYTQQIDRLPDGIPGLITRCKKIQRENKGLQIAIAGHSLTVNDKYHTASLHNPAPHVHVGLHFPNAHSLHSVAKLFDDNTQQVTKWDTRYYNLWAYLDHLTTGAKFKEQFKLGSNIIYSNFDFDDQIKQNAKRVQNNLTADEKLIQDFACGTLAYNDLLVEIDPYSLLKNYRKIQRYRQILDEQRHQDYLADFEGNSIATVLLAGERADKITIAQQLAQSRGFKDPAILTPSDGYFSNYNGEPAVIVEVPDPDYFSRASNRRIREALIDGIIYHPDLLDRQYNVRKRTVYLNLKLVIFVCDTSIRHYRWSDDYYHYQVEQGRAYTSTKTWIKQDEHHYQEIDTDFVDGCFDSDEVYWLDSDYDQLLDKIDQQTSTVSVIDEPDQSSPVALVTNKQKTSAQSTDVQNLATSNEHKQARDDDEANLNKSLNCKEED